MASNPSRGSPGNVAASMAATIKNVEEGIASLTKQASNAAELISQPGANVPRLQKHIEGLEAELKRAHAYLAHIKTMKYGGKRSVRKTKRRSGKKSKTHRKRRH